MADGKSALIIANSRYQDPDLRQLVAPAYDAEALARVLGNPAIGGFEVKTLLDKPAREVSEEIEKFFLSRRRGDLLLLYFSGHGIKDDDGLLYFATPDTQLIERSKPLKSSAVSAEFIKDVMRASKSRRQILMLDCCYSGAFAGALMAKGDKSVGIRERFAEGRGMVVITASNALQYSFEGSRVEGEGQRSVFTRTMVEGIETGKADLNHDGEISLDELYEYVYEHVSDQTPEQRPRKWDLDIEGKIFLAHSPTLTPADLPPELLEAIANPLARVRYGAIEELGALLRGSHKGLALAAQQALIRLKEDDSRRIAAAADDALSLAASSGGPLAAPLPVLPPEKEAPQPSAARELPQPAAVVAIAPDKAIEAEPAREQKVVPLKKTAPMGLPHPSTIQPVAGALARARAEQPSPEREATTPAKPQARVVRSLWKSWKVLVPLGLFLLLLSAIWYYRLIPAPAPRTPSITPTPTSTETAPDKVASSGRKLKVPGSGSALDYYNEGMKYLQGDGVAKNYNTARQLFERAAEAGHAGAMLSLGNMSENGQGGPQDYQKALEWFERSAAAGNTSAMWYLGFKYRSGIGVPRDYTEARKWYEKAAAAGNTMGMQDLGEMYENGTGVPRDYKKARELYEEAAAGGLARAMTSLGDLYRDGKGLSRNYKTAKQWYEKAAAAGDMDAKTRLQKLAK